MSTQTNIETNYSLYNTDNFKKTLDVTTCVILNKYKDVFEALENYDKTRK